MQNAVFSLLSVCARQPLTMVQYMHGSFAGQGRVGQCNPSGGGEQAEQAGRPADASATLEASLPPHPHLTLLLAEAACSPHPLPPLDTR